MTDHEEIKQAIHKAWLHWHRGLPRHSMPISPTPAFEAGFVAAVKWMKEKGDA